MHPDDKKSFGDLVEAKGVPVGGVMLNIIPLGYNEAKAIRINESGLYSLVLGSKKKERQERQDRQDRQERQERQERKTSPCRCSSWRR